VRKAAREEELHVSYKDEPGELPDGSTPERDVERQQTETAANHRDDPVSRRQQLLSSVTAYADKFRLPMPPAGGPTQLNGRPAQLHAAPRDSMPEAGRREETSPGRPAVTEELVAAAAAGLLAYLQEERGRFRPQGRRLNEKTNAVFAKFFPLELLEQVRVVASMGQRLATPPFFERARQLGIANLPDLAHKSSITYLDVVVFNERMTDRELFHGLVLAAQARVLGERLFAELFVRGLARMRSYPLAPMKAQAFALDTRFAADPERGFSVEEEIRRWFNEGLY
jgi:hypothetical protein